MKEYVFKKRTMHLFKGGETIEPSIEAMIPTWLLEGRIVPVGKVEEKLKPELADKLAEIEEDLMDDGKLNYSNDVTKKSPGRKPKKKTVKKIGFFGRTKKVK